MIEIEIRRLSFIPKITRRRLREANPLPNKEGWVHLLPLLQHLNRVARLSDRWLCGAGDETGRGGGGDCQRMTDGARDPCFIALGPEKCRRCGDPITARAASPPDSDAELKNECSMLTRDSFL
ncbi:hypothetical protein CEXT_194531 [Caerostris extrusa]|uniref:Uncharacterized protein n=1 Tax=Caerostris extrusa TaxID=172846 RepID=A0AAV4MN92_CAEEX|nr:hypothetical protein CEXT_194531 [Caerostris extrusa]